MAPARPEKRRFTRRQCALPIELRTSASPYPINAETTDLSPAGCYVTVLSAYPVGAKLDIVLWVDGEKMSLRATVITSDANVGNGIEFTGISREQIARLQAYLDRVQAPAASSDIIFH